MKKEQIVIYVGNFDYPDGNAAGKRVLGNLEAINKAGFKTVCLCFRKTNNNKRIIRSQYLQTDLYTIPYTVGFKRLNNSEPKRAFRLVLNKYSDYKIKAVIMYNSLGTTEFNSYVIKECHKRGIKAYYDIADYFDVPHRANILRYYMKKRELAQLMNRVLPACDGWIAISSFLKKMMPDPKRTIIVPPLAVTRVETSNRHEGTVIFSYATYIVDKNRPVSEWKDRIDLYIDAFCGLLPLKCKHSFELHFLGFNKEELIEMFPEELRGKYEKKLETIKEHVKFFGSMPNKDVQKQIMQSDFTLLFRDSKTSNNAGFPTKISESVSLGIPPVTNITSDIGKYIKDGQNGVIVPDPSNLNGIIEKIRSILNMDDDELQKIREGTVKTEGFYYASYADRFMKFLK